jgi:hypothetical protein
MLRIDLITLPAETSYSFIELVEFGIVVGWAGHAMVSSVPCTMEGIMR